MPSFDQKQREKMLTEPIPKLVASLAVPSVITQLVSLIYNTADTYFISQLNESASAAVGAVFAIMALIQAVGFGFAMGVSSLCSRLLGKNERERALTVSSSGFYGAIVSGALLAVIGLVFFEPLLRLIGCSETMLPYARPYARCILLAAPLSCPTFVLANILRSEGQAKTTMIATIVSGLCNLVLDPILIFPLGLGTLGAALATVASQAVNFAILFFIFFKGKTVLSISPKYIGKNPKIYGTILLTGFPTVARQGLASVATAAMSKQAVVFGDAAVAAINIAGKCYMLIRSVVIGVGQGFQPVAGYNFGAKRYDRTKQSFAFSVWVSTALCIAFAAFTSLAAEPIIAWFSSDRDVIEIGRKTLLYLSAAMPLLGFSTFVNQLYQCLGFKVRATLLASCRQGIFYLPAVWILPIFIGLSGVEMAQAVADIVTAIVSIPFLVVMFKKILKEQASPVLPDN